MRKYKLNIPGLLMAGLLTVSAAFPAQAAEQKSKVFSKEAMDFTRSPYTGLTRKSWIEAARYLLNGAFQYIRVLDDQMYFPKQLEKTYPRNAGQMPVAKLEGLARTLFVAAPLLREDSNLVLHKVRVADYYRHQLVNLSNPKSVSYIPKRTGGPSQTLLELGSLVISIKAAPDVLWNPLSKAQKDSLASLMKSYGEGPTIGSNWRFFNVFIMSFLKDQGYATNDKYLEFNLRELLKRYRGEGWYNDAPAYDYYSAWAYQTYGPLWVHFFGKQFPDIAKQFLKNEEDMAENYPYMFAKDGRMNMWGRSIPYRFACVSPLPWLEMNPACKKMDYGWMRHIASSTLRQFMDNPKFLEGGIPTMGFYGEFAPCVQIYSCRGSVYWMGKAFYSLLLPETAKFWSEKENCGPWDTDFKKDKVYNKFQPATGLLITDYPNSGAAEMRSWCHESVKKDWQKFRSSENYNKLAYNTEFPWMADGKNGEVSMNYATLNKQGKWEVLRLYDFKSFKDGVYRRDAVLETDTTVKYQLADIPLPDGVLRVDRVTTSSPTEIRLGSYSLADAKEQDAKEVGVPYIYNGKYTLCQLPLEGWTSTFTAFPEGLHPESDRCGVVMSSAKVNGTQLFITLQLWKKGKYTFTKDVVKQVIKHLDCKNDKRIEITLADGTKKVVSFE